MSNFSQFVTCRLDFDNGYSVSFHAVAGMGTMFCTLRYKGDDVDMGKFITAPGKGDGFMVYLAPESFAEVIYRISREAKVDAAS